MLTLINLISFIIDPGDFGSFIFMTLLFAVPFLVVYFVDYVDHPVIKVIFLIVSIIITLFLLTGLARDLKGSDLAIVVVLAISNLLSCVTAMIFPKDSYW